ncbi:hypothetical protein MSG28_012311 [Choristoneura fumiferana]|uniref:Uncharacterized protein n=1 Tax=Choristoneura fumiferana TaxID=7141 RepID=A0ACC0KCP4_CHOFU|nr:hypothetical protein MSG28_012311 [Choristoneura fumiferana]
MDEGTTIITITINQLHSLRSAQQRPLRSAPLPPLHSLRSVSLRFVSLRSASLRSTSLSSASLRSASLRSAQQRQLRSAASALLDCLRCSLDCLRCSLDCLRSIPLPPCLRSIVSAPLLCLRSNAEAFGKYGLLTLTQFQQLIQLGIVFELISTKGEEIVDDVYGLPWECMDYKNRKTILFFLQNVQKPMAIKAGDMVPVGVQTMFAIIKASCSYFVMLTTFAQEE